MTVPLQPPPPILWISTGLCTSGVPDSNQQKHARWPNQRPSSSSQSPWYATCIPNLPVFSRHHRGLHLSQTGQGPSLVRSARNTATTADARVWVIAIVLVSLVAFVMALLDIDR